MNWFNYVINDFVKPLRAILSVWSLLPHLGQVIPCMNLFRLDNFIVLYSGRTSYLDNDVIYELVEPFGSISNV